MLGSALGLSNHLRYASTSTNVRYLSSTGRVWPVLHIPQAKVFRFGAANSQTPALDNLEWSINEGEGWAVVSSGGSEKAVIMDVSRVVLWPASVLTGLLTDPSGPYAPFTLSARRSLPVLVACRSTTRSLQVHIPGLVRHTTSRFRKRFLRFHRSVWCSTRRGSRYAP